MKEELLKQLKEAVDITKQGILKGVEVLQEQCPLLVKEILRWEFAVSLLWCMVGVIFFIITTCFTIMLWKKWMGSDDWKKDCPDDGLRQMIGFVNLLFFVPWVCVICHNIEWLKIIIAPRLFLVEYVTQLIK